MKKTKKKSLIFILTIAVIIVLVIICSCVLTKYYSPEKALERMFSLRADMKLEEYYECFDIPENSKNPLNTLNAYLESAEKNNFQKINSFSVNKKSTNKFIIEYGDIKEEIELIKQDKKAFGLFDTYKIMIESVSEPLLYFVTHHGAVITINGVTIAAKSMVDEADVENQYLINSSEDSISFSSYSRVSPLTYFEYYDDTYDNYCFTNVFDNDYNITITTDYTTPYSDVITPSETPYVFRELLLSEEAENEIKEVSEAFMKKYYYALQDGEDFEVIKSLISQDEECIQFFENDYNELFGLFNRGQIKSGITDICFLESSSSISYPPKLSTNQQQYYSYVTLMYSYNSISYDGYLDEYTYNNDIFDETTFTLTCVKENGKWVVSGIEDTLIDIIY